MTAVTTTKKGPVWTDRQRTMLTLSRGVPARIRHLANDLKQFLPQIHSEPKFEKKAQLQMLNEMAELSRCQRVMYFECRSGQDVYLWLSSGVSTGPSVKFRVQNVHTTSELNFTGNCLKFSRPILTFDSGFNTAPHLKVLKELFKQIFHVPEGHPKSKPFYDHVMNFGLTNDGRIWIRFYEIPGADVEAGAEEIGPRFVLELARIFGGSFEGEVLYNNPFFIAPRIQRQQIRLASVMKAKGRHEERQTGALKRIAITKVRHPDPVGEIYDAPAQSDAAKRLAAEIDAKPKRKKRKTAA
uniref:Ribosome biogenesis protein BRX1 homolog n=2 Tax=Panagrellus redivivus TaxID=6233 RepID=A0A7E4VZ33_PANRE